MSIKRIIIPARAGSKGWSRKNVRLFEYTASIIPRKYKKLVTVSTDDIQVAALAHNHGYKVYDRPVELADDTSDIKTAMMDTLSHENVSGDDIIIMLYLTYPYREWEDVERMYNSFITNKSRSMLCRQPVVSHPCLMMYDTKDGGGTPVVEHNHYQRQQYPNCFEISHYICMFRAGTLPRLGKNMYNSRTTYYSIERCVDVDCEEDFIKNKKQHEYKDSYK